MLFIIQGFSYINNKNNIPPVTGEEQRNSDGDGITFDPAKRNKLITRLRGMTGEIFVPADEFFDGNINDLGSIGCNLYPGHPGINTFRSILYSLQSREDVDAVYIQIS